MWGKHVDTVPDLWHLFKEPEDPPGDGVQKGERIISWQDASGALYT